MSGNAWDIHAILVGYRVANANTEDFAENEIRTINGEMNIYEMDKWDRILPQKEPIECDIGMNKKREMFWYRNGKWKSIQ